MKTAHSLREELLQVASDIEAARTRLSTLSSGQKDGRYSLRFSLILDKLTGASNVLTTFMGAEAGTIENS